MKRTAVIIAAAALLAGCTGSSSAGTVATATDPTATSSTTETGSTPPTTAATSTTGATASPTSTQAPTTTSAEPTSSGAAPTATAGKPIGSDLPFGKAQTWASGLAVTVDQPEDYTPSSAAVILTKSDHYVKVTITLKNGTGSDYDPNLFVAQLRSGGADGQLVYDPANLVTGAPTETIGAGQTTTFYYAYGVKDTGDLAFTVTPGSLKDGSITWKS